MTLGGARFGYVFKIGLVDILISPLFHHLLYNRPY
jgi:hypothetical protein